MSEYNVDYAALASSATSAATLAKTLLAQLDQITSQCEKLSSIWNGEDATESIQRLQKQLATLKEQSQYFDSFASTLQSSADMWRMFEHMAMS